MDYVISKFDRSVSACLFVNTGTSGCSWGPLLCGVPLNISEGKEKCGTQQTADTHWQSEPAEQGFQEPPIGRTLCMPSTRRHSSGSRKAHNDHFIFEKTYLCSQTV